MQKIIAGNWKMHKIRPEAAKEAATLAQDLSSGMPEGRLVIIFPPYTDIATVSDAFAGVNNMAVGGQNFYPAESGPYTGEISPAMLRDAGAIWALVGHSERRHLLGECDDFIAKKVAFGLGQGFKIMLCIGETLEERDKGQLKSVLGNQLTTAISAIDAHSRDRLADRLAIAYEPVWAIGTGKVAGKQEIAEAHSEIREILKKLVSTAAADIPILYGGSVKADNASEILAIDNVDGLLVGGASLDAKTFLEIIHA